MKNIENVKEHLIKVLGGKKVVTDQDILDQYGRDETPEIFCKPQIVVRAETVQDISTTLSICYEAGIPVTPRGAGTGVTAGAIPVVGGVVLSLERLNRILEVDTKNMVAIVEPGVITSDIQQAVGIHGLMYPPDPASLDMCTIGGNIAENAGGPCAVKYGTTKDYVLGLEFVLSDGTIMQSGGKTVKNAAGYNIIGVLLGSEGTLAVITKIFLRLIPSPTVTYDILLPFSDMDQAIENVCNILQRHIIPAAIEFMDADALQLVRNYLKYSMPFPDAGAHLLIRLDGHAEAFVAQELEELSKVVSVENDQMYVAVTSSQKERLWSARRSIREAIKKESSVFMAEDCVVPRSEIPDFLRAIKNFCYAHGLRSIMFGHAGDGNVHIDILKGDMDIQVWHDRIPEIKREIYQRALDCGGTITGEHGIGYIRRDFLPLAVDQKQIELMRRIKNAFDPKNILNPGKVFPKKHTEWS
ncbi:MAG: FAD-binding oxidoreductase [Desulfobacterota bacterium]|nr:FAD-binding oxidoreductase [Thermodesulfobacteriota bacterium]